MEKQQPVHIEQESNTPANSGTAAAYFVILKQAPGSSGTERSMVVAKQELGGIGCLQEKRNKLVPGPAGHPFECHSGNVCVTLENQDMWNQFYKHGTEMVLTKRGRRMFPYCRFCILGLDPLRKYILVMDIAPVDNHRYKWNGRWWEISGKAEPHVLGRVYIHPNSPSSGSYWMRQPISFHKLKLTNNTLDQEGHIILHSMHRYLPRLHIIPADKLTDVIPLNGPNVHTVTFPQTEFVAVTAYQNIKITQLKIDFNPFAKGFRDDGLNSKPMRELRHQGSESMDAGCSDDSASSNSVATESSERLSIKIGERSEKETEHRKTPGDIRASPGSSFDGEFYDADEEADCPEDDISKINELDAGIRIMKKRTTESILKCLPRVYSTHPFSVTSSEEHEEPFNIIVKEEPPDDYEYNRAANPIDLDCGGLKCKEEEEYLDSEWQHSGTNRELVNKSIDKRCIDELDATSSAVTKRPLNSPTGVAKAKMLRVESTKVPVVYLEPCTVTKDTIKISELPQKLLSPCRRSGGQLPTALHSPDSAEKPIYSPSSAEKSQVDSTPECSGDKETSSVSERTENKTSTSTVPNNPTASHSTLPRKSSGEGFRFRKIKYTEKALNSGIWRTPSKAFFNSIEDSRELPTCSKSPRLSTKAFSSGIWRPPDGRTDSPGETSVPPTDCKSSRVSAQQATAAACRRGRPKKLRLSAKRSHSALEAVSALPSTELEKTVHDASPDLDDVEGVTFVSYASQDALQSHLVEQNSEDLSNPILQTADPQESEEEKIEWLEKKLLDDFTHLDPRVIMHPILERAGLKPSSLMSTGSLNLKHLGVVISPSSASLIGPAQGDILELSPIRQVQDPSEEEISFVSRTGKTNDFTKLKGWKQKLEQQSGSSTSKQTEASTKLEGSIKNRSVFSSDKLDEYLENEEKIIEQRAALCTNKISKVVYQMPTKSSSYVRTLDSVLKHQASQADCRGYRSSNQTTISPLSNSLGSVSKSIKQIGTALEPDSASKEQKSANNAKMASPPARSPAKTSSLRLSSAPTRPPGLSKKQIKLMNLENGALWAGKPRTYITEERAEAALVTLLTAQGSLSSRKRRVIARQVPLCKNEFCRLGCICSSLSHVKQPPKHCRKPECMFSCKCPKRKVLVLKSFAKRKKQVTKALREDLIFYDALAEDEDWKPRAKKRKRKKVVEYAVPEPEQPVRSYPLWVREEGEVDPEPVYTAPHLESCHTNKKPSLSQPQSPLSPKESGSTEVQTVQSTPASSPKPSEVDEKGPVYWYFESMMTCARVRIFERKDVERSITCTCSPKHCCRQGNSKVNNNGTVTACKLKWCSNSTREALDSEKLDGFESNSMSPDAAQTGKWKSKEKTDSPSDCDSPQGENTSLQSEEPQMSVESKNTPKLIEIISDCNWEAERTNILGVLARYTANKGTLEKIRIGNFLVEIVSNCGKGQDASPGSVFISSSVVKITQSNDKEGNGKNSICNMSVQAASKSSGLKLTETRPIAPKEKLPTPANCTVGEKEVTTFQSGSKLASKQKPAFDTASSTSRKSGMIQFTGNASGDTMLTLGQVGALHPVNWVMANLKKKVKSVEPSKKATSSTVASSTSAHFPSKHLTSCTTSPGSEVSRDTNDAGPVNQAKGNYNGPDNYTHLVINKVGALWKTKSCFSSLEPVCNEQQLGTPSSTISTNVSAGISPLTTVKVMPATPGSEPVTPGTSQKSISVVTVSTGAVYTAGSRLLKTLETTDAAGSQISGMAATKRLGEESAVTSSTVETPAKSAATTHFAVISASSSGVRTMPTLTKVLPPSSSTITDTAVTNTVNTRTTIMSVASMANKTPGLPKHSETSNSTPDLSKTTKTEGPQLLLIPMQSGPPVRPVQNLQLTPGQKMILQPLRCPGGKLFQHPNGQIIQLVPLPNSGPVSRPNLHQMVTLAVRNPGSVSGICLPTPTKSSSVAPSPSNSTLHPKGIIPQRGRPRSIPVARSVCVALKRPPATQPISPVVTEVPVTTTSQAKFVTVNGVGQTINARHLVPLQPVGFALLQLPPGQKNVPNAIITTRGPLKVVSPPSGSQSSEKADSDKTANQDSKSEEQLIEPGLEEIHVADSELIETTVSEGIPDEDHVNAYPLPEVKQGTESEAVPSTPSISEVDDELEDDSVDHQNALEHPTPAELADHSYTSEKQIVEEDENSLLENSTRTGKESAVDKDTSGSNQMVDREPDERPSMEEENWLQDEQMEVETEIKENWYETSAFNVPFKRGEDIDSENEEMDFDQTLLRYTNILESDKDTDSQSDLEDGDIQTDVEEIDVEKMFDSTSSEEAVDIETVEELSEKINIARLIASASRHHTSKTKCHFHNPYITNKSEEEEEETKPKPKLSAHLSKEAKAQLDALVVYRTAHTVNERRRRSEMRDLFERLKRTLGLRREEKASKYFILKQAFAEIQNLQDYSDCLSAEKSIQTRRRDLLIRKVSLLTGKTEEVILKKLEYICAKQRALDVEKKKFMQETDDARKQHSNSWSAAFSSSMDSLQKVAMDLQNQKPPNITMLTSGQDLLPEANTGKPLILTRKRSSTASHSSTSPIPLTAGSLLMTPQGQVLTLKGPLISGQTPFFTAEGLLNGNQPKGDGVTGTSIAGIASVTIQLQGLPVPLQVNNFTIGGSLGSTQTTSTHSSTRAGMEAVSSDSADVRQSHDARLKLAARSVDDEASSFMMPRIVNVTSLATGEAPMLNVEEANDSFAPDPQPLDFSMKGRKPRPSQGQPSPPSSKKPSLSTVKNGSQPTGKFTVPDDSEVMSFLVSSEAAESECARQQAQQIASSRSVDADKIIELPKALDLSDGTGVSCTRQAWTRDVVPGELASVTEIILGDKLELQVMSGRMQTCSIDKAAGQSDRDAELSSSQLLEPLLKANGSATGDMVDTEGYEPFTSLLNELAFLNQQFSDEENPGVSSMSDHHTLGFIDGGNHGDCMDELLIHGPVRLVDIDGADGATVLKQVAGRESGCSTSPLVLQLEGEDLNVEQLLGDEMPVDSQSELDNGALDFEGDSSSGSNSSVNVSPPPLIQMRATSSSASTEISSSLDMLWRPMPKLAPLGLVRGTEQDESSAQVESGSENSPESNKPMPALARISSPQQPSMESPEVASEKH